MKESGLTMIEQQICQVGTYYLYSVHESCITVWFLNILSLSILWRSTRICQSVSCRQGKVI